MNVRALSCINVCSNMNPWIDFVIIPLELDFAHVEDIVNDAYYTWWDNEEIGCNIPLAEYIEMRLRENEVEYEIYFKNDTEEEE